jgi:hypothetical protein
MSFATKLCHVVYADGSAHDVMKHPNTDSLKISFPGRWRAAAPTPPCLLLLKGREVDIRHAVAILGLQHMPACCAAAFRHSVKSLLLGHH